MSQPQRKPALLAAAGLAIILLLVLSTVSAAARPQSGIDASILGDAARSDDDRYRDRGFKPLEIYAFFGIADGMIIGDLMPSRGYHTRLISGIVGSEGKLIAILSTSAGDESRTARGRQRLLDGIGEPVPDNLEIVADLAAVPADSLDLVLTVRNYHDLGGHQARLDVLPDILRVIKPGGTFAVIDAYTDKPEERDESVHRINDELAQSEITSAGFEFVAASDLLVNADDTYDFDGRERAGVRGATQDAPIHRYFIHRWVHKYRKPVQ